MSEFERSLTQTTRNLMRFIGAAGGLYMVRRGLAAVTEAYKVQEKAERDLMAAIRLTDAEYKSSLATLKQYAAELQRQTIYGDEAILSQMAYVKNLGVTTDQLKQVTEAAIGLAAKLRLDLSTSMMLMGRASQGQTQMLTRYGIVLADTLSEQEKFNELLRIGSEAFALAREETQTLSGRLEQLANRWGDIKEQIAGDGGVVDAYADLLDAVEQNEKKWSWFFATMTSGLAEILSGFESVREVVAIVFGRSASPFRSGGAGPKHGVDAYRRMAEEREAMLQQRDAQQAATAQQQAAKETPMLTDWIQQINDSAESQRMYEANERRFEQDIIDRARQAAEAVRYQDYLTRRERIESLRLYQQQNAETLARVAEANRILNDEIASLERSRLDQMQVYFAEMREQSEDTYLTMMEHAAAYNRQMKNDFVSMWDPFIDGTKSAEEVMKDFFRNFFIRLAQAQAQAAMMQIWNNSIGPAVGMFTSALFGAGTTSATVAHGGGLVGDIALRRTMPASAFAGAPRYHDGLGANEFPAILERGERVIPAGGGAGSTVNIGTYVNRVDATDAASFEAQLHRSRHAVNDLVVMTNKGNHPLRRDTE
jgi:hypothetical protein